jgi:hypothetical protein
MASLPPIVSCQPATGQRSFLGLILFVGLLVCMPVQGLTVVPRSFDDLVQLADVVIVGTVKEVHSEFGNGGLDQHIFSFVNFNDLQVIKGQVAGEEYALQVPGGVVGRIAQDYPGVPVFHIGQRYVVFVRGNNRDFFPVVGITQGLFRVMTDAQGRQVVVRDDAANHATLARSLNAVTNNAPGLDTFLQQIRDRLPSAEGSLP